MIVTVELLALEMEWARIIGYDMFLDAVVNERKTNRGNTSWLAIARDDIGALRAEIAVAKHFQIKYAWQLGRYQKPDVGMIQVKWSTYHPCLIVPHPASLTQDYPEDHPYLKVVGSIGSSKLDLVGWMMRDTARTRYRAKRDGNHYVPAADLNPIATLPLRYQVQEDTRILERYVPPILDRAGKIHFDSPPGWRRQTRPTGRIYQPKKRSVPLSLSAPYLAKLAAERITYTRYLSRFQS